jgi:Zn-finger nucleic acid-binding protein
MSERQGIEIDYCPTCRGVWLDRGELDKIIDKSMAAMPAKPSSEGALWSFRDSDCHDGHGYHEDHRKHDGHHGYRKRSWLGDLFD